MKNLFRKEWVFNWLLIGLVGIYIYVDVEWKKIPYYHEAALMLILAFGGYFVNHRLQSDKKYQVESYFRLAHQNDGTLKSFNLFLGLGILFMGFLSYSVEDTILFGPFNYFLLGLLFLYWSFTQRPSIILQYHDDGKIRALHDNLEITTADSIIEFRPWDIVVQKAQNLTQWMKSHLSKSAIRYQWTPFRGGELTEL